MSISAFDLDLANANLTSVSSISAKINYRTKTNVALTSTSTVVANATLLKGITNITSSRTYTANGENLIFNTTTPYIEDGDNGSYTITLASSQGQFGTTGYSSSSSLSYNGTKSEVNTWFSTIKFYPTKDYTGSVTLNYTQVKTSGPTITKTATFTNSGTATITPTIYTFNYASGSSQSWSVLRKEQLYCQMDYLVVGGGGGGGGKGSGGFGGTNAGGGGGSGAVVYATNQSITASSYSIYIGSGGASAESQTTYAGLNGQPSQIVVNDPYTILANANGGNGGGGASSDSTLYVYTATTGDSPSYSSGTPYFLTTGGSIARQGGPGGGGSTGAGGNGTRTFDGASYVETPGAGGNGTTNSITGSSVVYAKGGNGSSTVGSTTIGTYNLAQQSGMGSGGTAGKSSYANQNIYINSQSGFAGVVIIKTHV
jgi:hypothetical protein